MKLCLSLIILLSVFAGCKESDDLVLKVVTFNIRYDNPADSANAWPKRKEFAVSFLRSEKPDLFGLQEALYHQYSFLDSTLTGYSSVAAGRDDGLQKGEMTPLFYNSRMFDLQGSGTFWLSETTAVPGSRGWGAALPRIVTWVNLKDRTSGKEIFCFNTHFSHMSDSARVMSARILYDMVRELSGNKPFVITGDFNMLPDSKPYAALSEDGFIRDSYTISQSSPQGPSCTFNGFGNIIRDSRIDYIFVSSDFSVSTHSTMNLKRDGLYISDHWPVKAVIKF
ncbi:MAG TPA: endonuclease/exonuclease/phosphatase family protein [Bacteroidales bacterium]|nr:endonuclease/exonuclease/phosphatase family protein [Bacteroidales bacterium]